METVEQITGEIEQRQRQLEGSKRDLESKQQRADVVIEQRKSHLLRASEESQRLVAQHLCKRNFQLLAQEVRIYCADLREMMAFGRRRRGRRRG